jgi:tetrahydromethanopterin S-methyltransferase subunit G
MSIVSGKDIKIGAGLAIGFTLVAIVFALIRGKAA